MTPPDTEIFRLGDYALIRRGPNPRTGDDRVLKVPAGEFPIVQSSPGSVLSDMVEAAAGKAVSQRELATLLAALRYWQDNVVHSVRGIEQSRNTVRTASPEHFEEEAPLDSDEIDTLCEKLNGTEEQEEDVHA